MEPVTDGSTKPTDQPPLLFVCGLHRSGTSALARLLASAPGTRGLRGTGVPQDEGQHLQHLLPTANAHGGPGVFAFDPGAHLTEASHLAHPSVAQGLLAAWSPYWEREGRAESSTGPATSTLVEKSPSNLTRTRLLQALFPAARFLVVVRHPAVVAASTSLWRPSLSPGTLLRHWAHAYSLYGEDAPALRRTMLVRYEDLVGDPVGAVAAMAATLSVDDRVDFDLLEGGHSDIHLEGWKALQRRLGADEQEAAEDAAARYGYVLEPPFVLGNPGLG